MRLLEVLSIAGVLTTAYASNKTVSTHGRSTILLPSTKSSQGSTAFATMDHAMPNSISQTSKTAQVALSKTNAEDVESSSLIQNNNPSTPADLGPTHTSPSHNSTNRSLQHQTGTSSVTRTSVFSHDIATSNPLSTSEVDDRPKSQVISSPTSGSDSRSSNNSTSKITSSTLRKAITESSDSTTTSNDFTSRNSLSTESSRLAPESLSSNHGDSSSGTIVTTANSDGATSTPHPSMVNSTSSASSPTPQAGQTGTSDQSLPTASSRTEASGTTESFLPIASLTTGTSTVTSVPSGVTFESIPAFTGNTWTTTTGDHSSSTIVPIIGGVMIWHMPTPGPGIVFNLPDLPKFQLPSCIIGDCPEPPKVGEDDGKNKGDDDKDDKETDDDSDDHNDDDDAGGKEQDDKDDDQTSTSSSEASNSETTSSTSTCSGGETTVSDCRVACSTSYSWTDETITGTQRCFTTSCQQTVGCSIQPTTTTSTSSVLSACTGNGQLERYDPVATLSSLGLEMPLWMQFALTYDSIIAEETSDSTAEDASATEASATMTPTTTGDHDATTSTSTESTSFDPTSSLTSMTTQSSKPSFSILDVSHTETTSESASSATSTSLSSSSASSSGTESATMTISEATEPTPVCHDESDLPGHPPVDAALVDRGAELFCRVRRQWYPGYEGVTNMTFDSPAEKVTYQEVNSRVNYSYELVWKDGDACEYKTDVQQIDNPIGGDTWDCRMLFNTAYSGCNNGGVGGYLDAGCLRYTFTGGQDDDDVEFSPMPAGSQVKIQDLE